MLANIVLFNLIKESWVKSRTLRELDQVLLTHKLNICDKLQCIYKDSSTIKQSMTSTKKKASILLEFYISFLKETINLSILCFQHL